MKSQRVLIIDREKTVSERLEPLFVREGWISQYSPSAMAGIASAPRFRPTLVLLDLVAPTMDPTLFATLARSSTREGVVIIGMATIDSAQRQPQGIDDVLVKPIELSDVLRAISRG